MPKSETFYKGTPLFLKDVSYSLSPPSRKIFIVCFASLIAGMANYFKAVPPVYQ
jgi:hypothetical protein